MENKKNIGMDVHQGMSSEGWRIQREPTQLGKQSETHVRVGESVRYADGSGKARELTNWHSLSFYGKLADVARALKRGDNKYVDGRIEQR
jgi:single-stranded DNA-binding protein